MLKDSRLAFEAEKQEETINFFKLFERLHLSKNDLLCKSSLDNKTVNMKKTKGGTDVTNG